MGVTIIAYTAYVFSVASFVLFVILLVQSMMGKRGPGGQTAGGIGAAQQQGALADIAKLVEALAKLTDSFSKAGPMVMALVAATLFFLIAVVLIALPHGG